MILENGWSHLAINSIILNTFSILVCKGGHIATEPLFNYILAMPWKVWPLVSKMYLFVN